MARTVCVGKILLLGMLASASLVQAQQAPSSAPPKLERIEPGSDTPITVTPQQRSGANRSGTDINEKREGGRVTEVQVTTGGSSYTMQGAAPGSVAQTGDATGSTLRPPQWKVMEFDLFKKKQKDAEEADAGTATAPPPPPLRARWGLAAVTTPAASRSRPCSSRSCSRRCSCWPCWALGAASSAAWAGAVRRWTPRWRIQTCSSAAP